MKNIFLDTDILIDFLGDRKPFSRFALTIFLNGHHKKIKLHTSANSITTAYYILGKHTTEKHARELVLGLINQVTIIPVTEDILANAFSSRFYGRGGCRSVFQRPDGKRYVRYCYAKH